MAIERMYQCNLADLDNFELLELASKIEAEYKYRDVVATDVIVESLMDIVKEFWRRDP